MDEFIQQNPIQTRSSVCSEGMKVCWLTGYLITVHVSGCFVAPIEFPNHTRPGTRVNHNKRRQVQTDGSICFVRWLDRSFGSVCGMKRKGTTNLAHGWDV